MRFNLDSLAEHAEKARKSSANGFLWQGACLETLRCDHLTLLRLDSNFMPAGPLNIYNIIYNIYIYIYILLYLKLISVGILRPRIAGWCHLLDPLGALVCAFSLLAAGGVLLIIEPLHEPSNSLPYTDHRPRRPALGACS